MRRARGGVAALLVIAVSVTAYGASAGAAGARVTLQTSDSRVSAGTPIVFTVSAAGAGRSAGLVVERQFGSARQWRPVARVNAGRDLQVTTPGLGMGRYVFRAVAMVGSRSIGASAPVTVFSYGTISLIDLARHSKDTHVDNWGTGTVAVGGAPFHWQSNTSGNTGPGETPAVSAQNSSCRSFTVQFAVDDSEVQQGGVGQVGAGLDQTTAIEQDSNGSSGIVNTATFTISSPTWQLSLWASYGDEVYFAGTLSCWTSTGDA